MGSRLTQARHRKQKQHVAVVMPPSVRVFSPDVDSKLEAYKVVEQLITTGSFCRVTEKAAGLGEVDVILVPEAYVCSTVADDTPRKYCAWMLYARIFGVRLASARWLVDNSLPSVKFIAIGRRQVRLFFPDEFRAHNPGTVTLLEDVSAKTGGWRILSETPPMPPKGVTFFSIGSFRDSKVSEGCSSVIGLINSLSVLDVKNSTDGVERRGVVAKR